MMFFIMTIQKNIVFFILYIDVRPPLWLLYLIFLIGAIGVFSVGSHLYNIIRKNRNSPKAQKDTKDESIIEHNSRKRPPKDYNKEKGNDEVYDGVRTPSRRTLKKETMEEDINANDKLEEDPSVERVLKVIESDQMKFTEGFRTIDESGKSIWTNVNFIFAMDCSVNMKGARWNSLIVGFKSCLEKIKEMKDIYVTLFSFDIRVNPLSKEKTVKDTIKGCELISFTGREVEYKKPLEHICTLIKGFKYSSSLTCVIFLSAGLGGYPNSGIKELKRMKLSGKKILFNTVACNTNEDNDMIKMCQELQGEHYKANGNTGIQEVLNTILSV